MLRLFRHTGDVIDRLIPNEWGNVKQLMSMNESFRERWFRTSVGTDSNNPLVGLIMDFDVSLEDTYFTYARSVKHQTSKMANLFKFTHFGNAGEPTEGILNGTRLIVSVIDDGLPNINDWKTMIPLRIVETTEIDIMPFDMTQTQVSNDMVFAELDMMALMLMFRAYSLEMVGQNFRPNIPQFIRNYVIANAFPSYQSLALLNLYLGTVPTEEVERVYIPITFTSPLRKIEAMVRKYGEEVFARSNPLSVYLQSIPTLDGNALNTMRLTYTGGGSNNLTFEFVSRVRLVAAIFAKMSNDNSIDENGHIINEVWFLHKLLSKSGYLKKCAYMEEARNDDTEFLIKLKD